MDVSYIKFNSLSTATAVLELQSPSPRLNRDSSSRRPAPLCHLVAVRSWMSRSTPVGRIKWENLAKMLCQLWKASHIDRHVWLKGPFLSPTENRFFCVRNCVPVKDNSERVQGGKCLLSPLFSFWWLTINDSFQADTKYCITTDHEMFCPSGFCELYFSTEHCSCALWGNIHLCACVCVYTHARTHTHTHILYFPAQMVSSLSSYEWGHRYFPVCWHALSIAKLIPTTTPSSWKMWDAPDEMMWADFSVQWKGSGELYAWRPSCLCPQKSLWHLKTTACAGLTTLPLRDRTIGSGQKKIIDVRFLEWSNTGRHGASPNWNSNCTMCGGWLRL